jgi:hypothetical protein
MILEKQKEANVLQVGDSQESIGMSLDLDSAQILMQMLSKNLYSDAIGSTIRECASNALDSHRRAGVNKPIIVSLQANDTGGYEFSVEDFGIGLDAADVENIISKYGKSTKRNSDTELGMMGLGFKAPLAYCSSFYFIARKNGIERKYMMYEGEDVNTIDLLYTKSTLEENGVKVIVPINYYERYEFINKIREQLAYFENVYFNVMNDEIKNDFVIFKGEHFQFSELAKDSYLHICLDNVYYPIDFKKIGVDTIDFPLALRFGLSDGLFPTPNRESIRYTPEAKQIILKKIEKVADYFINKFNESIEDTDNIKAIIDFYSWNSRKFNSFGKEYDINKIAKHTTNVVPASPKLNGVKLLDLKTFYNNIDYLFQEYYCKMSFERGRMSKIDGKYSYAFQPRRIFDCDVYYYPGNISGLAKDYLRELSRKNGGKTILVVTKKKALKLGTLKDKAYGAYDSYRNILQLDLVPKSEWRERIKEYQYLLSLFTEKWMSIEDLVIPQSFIDSRKKVKATVTQGPGKRRKVTGEVVGKWATELQRWVDGRNCKWESKNLAIENLHKKPYLVIYGSHAQAPELDKLYAITNRSHVNFVTFSERELKIVNELELTNWMTYDKFMEGNNKTFKRIATVNLINTLYSTNREFFDKHNILDRLSMDISNKARKLREYRIKWYHSSGDASGRVAIDTKAADKNLYDTTIMDEYNFIKDLIEKHRFIKRMMGTMQNWVEENNNDIMFTAICDLCKYHGVKLNVKNYKHNLPEEEVTEEN